MSFDHLAPHYDWLEAVLAGGKLQRCRTAFLSRVRDRREVLVCGEGHGRFLLPLRRTLPKARITCVDSSAMMLDRARRLLAKAGADNSHIQWVCADLRSWAPPAKRFDLVATHFFLDCFSPEQLRDVIGKISSATQPGARWLISDFRVPALGPARVRARVIHVLMYRFFRATTAISARAVTRPDACLSRHGFCLEDRKLSDWGLLHADLWIRRPTQRRA